MIFLCFFDFYTMFLCFLGHLWSPRASWWPKCKGFGPGAKILIFGTPGIWKQWFLCFYSSFYAFFMLFLCFFMLLYALSRVFEPLCQNTRNIRLNSSPRRLVQIPGVPKIRILGPGPKPLNLGQTLVLCFTEGFYAFFMLFWLLHHVFMLFGASMVP